MANASVYMYCAHNTHTHTYACSHSRSIMLGCLGFFYLFFCLPNPFLKKKKFLPIVLPNQPFLRNFLVCPFNPLLFLSFPFQPCLPIIPFSTFPFQYCPLVASPNTRLSVFQHQRRSSSRLTVLSSLRFLRD